MSIFLTSDTHFGHDREFIWKARGYSSVEEMNEDLINKWNSVVSLEDEVYHLGDVMLGDNDKGIDCLCRLNGKIHIIIGNHDTDKRIEFYKAINNVTVDYAYRLKYKKYTFWLSHYPTITENMGEKSLYQVVANLHGHTHQISNFTNDSPYAYHVGVDSHNGIPVNIDNIIVELKSKFKECEKFL